MTLVAICLVAFALRVFQLEHQSLWYDEAFSAYLAHFDLAHITARTAADIQPPLYYYLLHFWIALAGDSEFALRFLSLVFGVLTIPLMFVIARRLFNRTPAIIASILATLAPLYIWYSQEARMYTLITLLLLLSSYALLKAIEGNGGNRWQVVFIVANIAAIYTHYFAFAVIAFQWLFVLVSSFRVSGSRFNLKLETLKPAIISLAIIAAAFLPWLPFVLARFGQDASYWRGALKLDEAMRHILINFTMGESVLESQAQWIATGWLVCLLISLLVGWWSTRKSNASTIQRSNHPIFFVMLYLIIPLTLLLFLFSRNPKFNARYLMIASPSFFLLLAAGLDRIWNSELRIRNYVLRFTHFLLAFSFLLLTSIYSIFNLYFDPAFTKASFRDVAQYIEQHSAPDEAIILTSGHLFPAFNYYYRGNAPQVRLPDDPTLNADHVLGYDIARVLNQTIAGKRGAWVVEWQNEVVDPNGFVPMMLSSRGVEQKLAPTNFYQVRLRYWTLPSNVRFPEEPAPAIRREANFKNVVKLLGATPTPTPADVGASFNLDWHALDAIDEDYLVALHVRDAAGNLWGKLDRRPAGYNYPTTRWKKDEKLFGAFSVPLLPGAPAGDYFIEVTLYTASDQRGLDILAPNGAPMGKSVKLGPIPVLPATQPATLASLNIQNTISQAMPPFTLLGYQLGRDKASAGESIPLTLFWRADDKPLKDYTFRIQFGDARSDAFPIANPQYPTSQWNAGEIVRGQYAIPIPASAKTGATKLQIVLSDGNASDLAPFTIEKTDRVFVKPNAQFAQTVNFSNSLALIGYDLSATTLKPGDSLKLVLYWHARAKMDKPYTVFVHLLDANNKVVAQRDAQPGNGSRPTTGWVENEFIADSYELKLAAPAGNYKIEIGWYDADFVRLQIIDDNGVAMGDNAILKTEIEIQ